MFLVSFWYIIAAPSDVVELGSPMSSFPPNPYTRTHDSDWVSEKLVKVLLVSLSLLTMVAAYLPELVRLMA
jgi:hypothetical protein